MEDYYAVGIISYIPEGKLGDTRFESLKKLIKEIDYIFRIPAIIVAQNWKDRKINYQCNNSHLTIFRYEEKLGITGARRELRKHFLESNFEYLIMLDDDSHLIGDPSAGELYLRQLRNNPGKFGVYKPSLLKLMAISKDVFRLIDYPTGEAENGDFFEDMYLTKALQKLYPDKEFKFSIGTLREYSDSAWDPNSTWYRGQFNKRDIGDRTRAMLKELDNENISS